MFYSFTVAVFLAIIFSFLIYLLKAISKNQLQQIFAVNLILLIESFVFMFLQIQFNNKLDLDPIYFDYFSYIGIVFMPVSIYFTSIIYTHTKIRFKPSYLLLCIIPILSLILLWTNNAHHLFFKHYSIQLSECVFGPWFYVHEIYSLSLYALAIIHLINYFKKNSGIFSQEITLIAVGTVFPFFINLLGTLGIVQLTVYVVPIALAISLICFAIALFKFQLLNALPIALTKIVNRISDGYIVLNNKNIITDLNEPFKEIFNISNLDIKQSHIFDLLAMEEFNGLDEETIIKALKAVIDSNETLIFEQKFPNIEKYLRLEINSIKSDGVFIGALILVKDLTQHHKDLEAIKSSKDMLMEKERLASLGQMIGGIAHNMKTPIFSISGATEGLTDLINEYRSSITDPEVTVDDHLAIAKDMEDWIKKIKNYTSYMSDIITAVRGQAVALTNNTDELFTIEELVKRVDILMKHELKSALINLNVSIQTDKNLEMKGNINSLVQVINNLISNAIQSYNGKTNEDIDLTIFKENQKLIITISDHGCGMSDEVQEKLFKEMITTKGKNGTGLGLFMSYSNIKAQFNGDLKFTSEEGKGTTFNLIIPIKK
jgi:signal transduction histidine kinase